MPAFLIVITYSIESKRLRFGGYIWSAVPVLKAAVPVLKAAADGIDDDRNIMKASKED